MLPMPPRVLPDTLFAHNHLEMDDEGVFRLTARGRSLYQPHPAHMALEDGTASEPMRSLALLRKRLGEIFRDPLACNDAAGRLREMGQQVDALVRRAPDACISAILITPCPEYTLQHALNASVLATLLGMQAQLDAAELETVTLAAMTMNIGTVRLQDLLAGQASPPSTSQRQLIRLHPILSSALLREMGVTDPRWHETVQTHHEEWNGRGYPFLLNQEEIGDAAHIVHLADIACAKLMPRGYRSRLPARQALAQLYQNRDEQFDARLVSLLVRELGFYPPGGFVELAGGELGVVVKRGASAQSPLVVLPDAPQHILDTSTPEHPIKGAAMPPRINLQQYEALTRLWENLA